MLEREEGIIGEESGVRGEEGTVPGDREARTFFRQSVWTTSETALLGFKILNLLPCILVVTR